MVTIGDGEVKFQQYSGPSMKGKYTVENVTVKKKRLTEEVVSRPIEQKKIAPRKKACTDTERTVEETQRGREGQICFSRVQKKTERL